MVSFPAACNRAVILESAWMGRAELIVVLKWKRKNEESCLCLCVGVLNLPFLCAKRDCWPEKMKLPYDIVMAKGSDQKKG